MERLQKIIAASGVASRREAERLIAAGLVTVNGIIVKTMGTTAGSEDKITVKSKPLVQAKRIVYLLNKPKGVVCSRTKQADEKIVTEFLPKYPVVYPVGRLDKESDGALLLTNDGSLAHQLMHPSFEHAKHYEVLCKWKDSPGDLQKGIDSLLAGVRLGDGIAKADVASAAASPSGVIHMHITVHEGRTHLVRRMCAYIGLKVTRLTRTRIGTLDLGNLAPGKFRVLTTVEQKALVS
jgi:23S rRNA pseudouridine2605 synthase